ncbi:MAG: VOC family protein [Acidimicrobiia bacterium]
MPSGEARSIDAVTLAVADMARSTAFYGSLGFEPSHGGPDATFTSFALGGQHLNLILAETAGSGRWAGWGRVIIHVDDVDAMHARAVAAGHAPEAPPRDAEWGERYFHLDDPDGHQLSFARPL